MQKVISIGKQNFVSLRENDCFYIDKTDLICKWWESKDEITLITRPRRFGKTLNMTMYANSEDFQVLAITTMVSSFVAEWNDQNMKLHHKKGAT